MLVLEPAGLCHLFHWALPSLLANLHLVACVFALVVMLHLFIVKQIYISSMYDLGIFIIQRAKGLEVSISRASNAKRGKQRKGGRTCTKNLGLPPQCHFWKIFRLPSHLPTLFSVRSVRGKKELAYGIIK